MYTYNACELNFGACLHHYNIYVLYFSRHWEWYWIFFTYFQWSDAAYASFGLSCHWCRSRHHRDPAAPTLVCWGRGRGLPGKYRSNTSALLVQRLRPTTARHCKAHRRKRTPASKVSSFYSVVSLVLITYLLLVILFIKNTVQFQSFFLNHLFSTTWESVNLMPQPVLHPHGPPANFSQPPPSIRPPGRIPTVVSLQPDGRLQVPHQTSAPQMSDYPSQLRPEPSPVRVASSHQVIKQVN